MKLNNLEVKPFLAIYVVVFCTYAMVYVPMSQLVIGALIGIISGVMGYYFGSSSGSSSKDSTINKMNVQSEIVGGNTPPSKDEK
jgi:hypothetical protein